MVGTILFRAQPFHNGHLNMVKKAYEECVSNNTELYIFVGSADKFGSKRNPLPINFRLELIEESLKENFTSKELERIFVIPLSDLTDESDNSYEWGDYLYKEIVKITKDPEIAIYYSDRPDIMLSWFNTSKRWNIYFKFLERYQGISATKVRGVLKGEIININLIDIVPNYVYQNRDKIKKFLI